AADASAAQKGGVAGMTARSVLNPRSLVSGGAGRLYGRRNRRSGRAVGLVLVHHGIAADQDPDAALLPALGADLFRAQLEYLRRHYEVVPVRDLAQRLRERSPGDRLPVAITFDDDLAGHASLAAPILEEFGFPATFFLNANTLDGPSTFWWQDLQAVLDRGQPAWEELKRRLAERWTWAGLGGTVGELSETIEASPPKQRDAIAEAISQVAGPPIDRGLPAETVKDLVGRGFEIGFHTLRHYSLPTLDDRELRRAMSEGVEELADVVGYRPKAISYPHGKADLRVAEAAEQAGFELGFITGHAATTPEQHPLLQARLVAWTDSLGSFAWALGRLASR
ncbi:MAG: polysaccharide deacetylase family protein, partial [Solirubrobacterales bacterium]